MAREFEGDVRLKSGYLAFTRGVGSTETPPANEARIYFDGTDIKIALGAAYAKGLTDTNFLATVPAITTAVLDPTTIQYVSTTVTAAQIKALFTTPITVVAAPGANKIILFDNALITYVYLTTEFTINGSTNLAINYTDGSGARVSTTRATTGFIDQTANVYEVMQRIATAVTPVVNAALVLTCAVANPTVGLGSIVVKVGYRVVPSA